MNKVLILLLISYSNLLSQIYPDNINGIVVDTILSVKINEKLQPVTMEIIIDRLAAKYKEDAFEAYYKIKIYDSTKDNLIQEIMDTLRYNFIFAELKLIDINLDDCLDIALVREITMHAKSLYHFWIYNPKTKLFNFNSDYSDLCCNMEIDTSKKEIFIGYYDFSNRSSEERHYKPYFDKPILYVLRETEKLEGIDSVLVKEYKMIDGELRKIKEYKVKDELGWE